jgi:hypothetical protein
VVWGEKHNVEVKVSKSNRFKTNEEKIRIAFKENIK